MDRDIDRSTEAGFVAHLTKPIQVQTLEAAIQVALSPSAR
jgi:CheY-like chemotaxis protein